MLTIFTPAYNRAQLLKRAYESLKRQTNKEFKWLIVDDGSTDDTKETVKAFIEEGAIDITYHYQENGGKMRAHNTGVRLCDTELFVCLDSDDYLTDNAVLEIISIWKEKSSKKEAVGGIVAHKGKSDSELLGESDFPENIEFSTLRGLYLKGFSGETTLVFKTEVLKNHLFPEIPGEKYVPEDVVYDRIDLNYELIVLRKILTVCEIVSEGYTDMAAKLRKQNPGGWFLYYEQRMVLQPFSVLKFKYISHYIIFAKLLGKNPFAEKKLSVPYILAGYFGVFILKLLGKT